MGKFKGLKEGKIDTMPYSFPFIEAQATYLWKKRHREYYWHPSLWFWYGYPPWYFEYGPDGGETLNNGKNSNTF